MSAYIQPIASDVVTRVQIRLKSGLESNFTGLGLGLGFAGLGLGFGTSGLGLGLGLVHVDSTTTRQVTGWQSWAINGRRCVRILR